MLNRKESKLANGSEHHDNGSTRVASAKGRRTRHRFIISPRAHGAMQAGVVRNGSTKGHSTSPGKPGPANGQAAATPRPSRQAPDLTETIKTLVHLAQEHGHVTYDDINDILPEGLTPEDLDELYTKLRGLDIEIDEASWPALVHGAQFQTMKEEAQGSGLEMVFEGGADRFFFKGTNGRWRDVLSEDDLALYEQAAAQLGSETQPQGERVGNPAKQQQSQGAPKQERKQGPPAGQGNGGGGGKGKGKGKP